MPLTADEITKFFQDRLRARLAEHSSANILPSPRVVDRITQEVREQQMNVLMRIMPFLAMRPFTMFEFLERGPRRPMFTFKSCGMTEEECLAELQEKLPYGVTPDDMAKGTRFG